MFTYFMITTFVVAIAAILLIYLALAEEDFLPIMIMLAVGLFWGMIAMGPTVSHTDRTEIEIVSGKEYPGEYKTIIEVGGELIPVNDTYLFHKVQKGEYKIEKHIHYNVFDNQAIEPTYYVVPTYE